jgi:hypothetical protein
MHVDTPGDGVYVLDGVQSFRLNPKSTSVSQEAIPIRQGCRHGFHHDMG